MKAKFLSTEGEYLEAQIEVSGKILHVMDCFNGDIYKCGDEINIDIQPGLFFEDEEWESMFTGNPNNEKKIEHQSGWSYRAYGIVKSINPVIVDCGIFSIEGPLETNDERLVGDSVAFTITRMDAN